MCGIVGYLGKENALEKIITGLETLEYRGYDSAGVAYVLNNQIKVIKREGRIQNLKEAIPWQDHPTIGTGESGDAYTH